MERSDNDLDSITLRIHICGDLQDFTGKIAYSVELTTDSTSTTLIPGDRNSEGDRNSNDIHTHGISVTKGNLTVPSTLSPFERCEEVSMRMWVNHPNVTNSTVTLEYRLRTNYNMQQAGRYILYFPHVPSPSPDPTSEVDTTAVPTTADTEVDSQFHNQTSPCTVLGTDCSIIVIGVLSSLLGLAVVIIIVLFVMLKSRSRSTVKDAERGMCSNCYSSPPLTPTAQGTSELDKTADTTIGPDDTITDEH